MFHISKKPAIFNQFNTELITNPALKPPAGAVFYTQKKFKLKTVPNSTLSHFLIKFEREFKIRISRKF